MDRSNTSIDHTIAIKSEPITDEDNERDEDFMYPEDNDIFLPDIKMQTFQFLMSDFDEFETLHLESLNIKSECGEAIENDNETKILDKSIPHFENNCLGTLKGNFVHFSSKNVASLEIKSERDPEENEFLFCAEVLDPSSSDVEDTGDKSEQLSDDGKSSELFKIKEEEMDLSYTDIDISYPDIKKECADYSAKEKDVYKKVIQCPQCKYTCSHISKLKYHAITHSGEKAFLCEHCDRSFRRKDGLKKHVFTHSGEKPFKCSQCNRAFGRKDCLKKHMLTHSMKQIISCSLCNITFIRKGDHKKHIVGHSRDSLYSQFHNNMHDYLKNNPAHNNGMPFKCPICLFSSSRKGNLKTHVQNHSGDKQFSCHQCNFSCNQKGNLNRHILTHVAKSLFFPSKQVSFARAQGSNLESETFTQRGIPFLQDAINFPQSGNTITPNLTRVERKPFKCSQCSFTCFSISMLHLHKLSLGAH